MISRRFLLKTTTALVSVGLLAGCGIFSSTTTNGITTVTVNVKTAVTYLSGFAAIASAILALPGISSAIGAPIIAIIDSAISGLNTSLANLLSAAGSSQTFTFNTTSVPSFITSVEQDASTILSDIETTMTSLGTSAPTQFTTYYNGLVSLGNAISALFSVSTSSSLKLRAETPLMSVQEALALVGIKS